MKLVMIYVKATFFDLLPIIPIVISARIVAVLLLRKRGAKTTLHHEIGASLFIYYLIAVFSVTIDFGVLFRSTIEIKGNVNLLPFREINVIFQSGEMSYILINIFGNILMFSPIGIFAPLLWKKTKSTKAIVFIGFIVSLFIEFMQLFSYRGTDVDDLILNTAGTLFGYIIFRLFYVSFRGFADKFEYFARREQRVREN